MAGASRELLFPGPLAPSSHFGVTLARQVVGTGLRYAFYHLGLPLPERPPVRILRLRLYLDGEALATLTAGSAAGEEVAAALVDPGGAGRLPPEAARTAWMARFHRARLAAAAALGGSRAAAGTANGDRESATALWEAFRALLSRRQRALDDALLGEVIAVLERRARRARGEAVPPVQSREAARFLAGQRCRLECLGIPDPLHPSWRGEPAADGEALRALAAPQAGGAAPHPLRGRFRERYRALLDELRGPLLRLAGGAHRRGLVEHPDDAFFLPFDLGDHLAAERPPAWLPAAVARNRAEHQGLGRVAGFPPSVRLPLQEASGEAQPAAWQAAPLAPLP